MSDNTLVQFHSDDLEKAITALATALNTAGLPPDAVNVLAMLVLGCEMGAQLALPRNLVKELIDQFLGPAEDLNADSQYAIVPANAPVPLLVVPVSGSSKKVTH